MNGFDYSAWLTAFSNASKESVLLYVPEKYHKLIRVQDNIGHGEFEDAPFAVKMSMSRGKGMHITADLSVYIAIGMLSNTPGIIMMYLMAMKLIMVRDNVTHVTFDWFMETFKNIPGFMELEQLWDLQKMQNGANACDYV